MKIHVFLAYLVLFFCSFCSAAIAEPHREVVPVEEVKWEKLNPARGDKSPQAGTLWGDRKGSVATGFLAKFVDGFSSPPHIHNVSYRAVVIKGLIHNDDPDAAMMWMPAGSFWTQPKGEAHITSAKGDVNIAYVEIDSGPYLVRPTKEAFDSGERPVNIDIRNLVWRQAKDFRQTSRLTGPEIALLWGDFGNGQFNGTMLKLPPGFRGVLKSGGSDFRAVLVEGELSYRAGQKSESYKLRPGSFFSAEGKADHLVSSEKASLIYIRTNGPYRIK